MNFVVVAYFTLGTLYEIEAKRLIASLMRFNLSYHIQPIEDKGSWYLNTQYKPIFLKEMLDKFPGKSIVYVDADAEFCRSPDLFNNLHARPDVNIGVHLLDHKKRGRLANFEMLSGTIYLKNNKVVQDILSEWESKCSQGGQLWDQTALCEVLKTVPFQVLPEEYCMIFDYMSDIKNPVIKHYQASRKVIAKFQQLPLLKEGSNVSVEIPVKPPKPEIVRVPRKIGRGGLVRYRCTRRNT